MGEDLILTGYGWRDPETGIEYATDAEALEAAQDERDDVET